QNLKQVFEPLNILTAEGNLGFGSGCNLGLQYVYDRNPKAWVWLINPDALLNRNAVTYVLECLKQQPNISILGTRIRDFDGQLWFAQGRFNWWLGTLKHRLQRACIEDTPPQILSSRWVSGCSMIFNLPNFDSCPTFDPNFFLDYEDAEICERYYRQGFQVGVTQAVLVTHAVSAVTHRNRRAKFRHATFSKLYFLHKHGSPFSLGLNLGYMLVWSLKLMLHDIETGVGRFQGLVDFIGWKSQAISGQLPSTPFRPQTAFTQANQTRQ
ncbi:MAG: glycosyltransferase family 2 protein, partial [Leptolyngbya sp. SIO1D8]|nr:glycosyltransferase family 2 protein [Leptolyngbya sp. SIO1D8]